MSADPSGAPKVQMPDWSPFAGPSIERDALARPVWPAAVRDIRIWLTGLAAMIAVAVLAGALIWQSRQAEVRERTANGWYAHTQDVLIEIGQLTTALADTQRGARGYLLTGEPEFLAPYDSGRRDVEAHLGRLRALTADNPVQQRRLVEFTADVTDFLSVNRHLVELQAGGRREEALAIIHDRGPNAALERAKAVGAALSAEEQRLLAERRQASLRAMDHVAKLTLALAILGTALLIATAALAWLAIAAAARSRLATLRADANERLAATGALLSMFVKEAPAAIAIFDRQMRYLAASRRFAIDHGLPGDTDLIGQSHYKVFPEVPQRWREIHARVLAGETLGSQEDSFSRPDGRVDWVTWRMEPWRDPHGEIGGAVLFSEVITAQVEALRAHLAAEARLRAIVETAGDAILVIDEAGVIQSANPAATTIFGYATQELVGRDVSLLMPEPHRSAHDGYIKAYLQTGVRKIIGIGREVEGLHKSGARLAIDLAVAEWRDGDRRFFTGLVRDVSERKIAEAQRQQAERRELVIHEFRHRINNMFSVIQALISASARSRDDVRAYRDALLKRVAAFAAAQVELASTAWTSRAMRDLIDFELKAYAEADTEVSLQGPDVRLNASAAESLAMIIHELATNAAKYGALSRPGATLSIHWGLGPRDDRGGRLIIEWLERGGPPVAAPQRRGFGSTVIESCARSLGGTVRFAFDAEGLRCTIEADAAVAESGVNEAALATIR